MTPYEPTHGCSPVRSQHSRCGGNGLARCRAVHSAPVDVGYVHWCAESCLHLDPVDRQIVIHLVHGKSNQQIGDSVCLTESAVKSRLEAVMRKLGVNTRTQLAVLALKTGIE